MSQQQQQQPVHTEPLETTSDFFLVDSKDTLSCVSYFDEMWRCYTPAHQLTSYYHTGNVDDCALPWKKLLACTKLQMSHPNPTREDLERKFPRVKPYFGK
eukprot:TRINITY_DN2209_c0_g2_i2.p3 TRINITY_DN2209_c0_g2~~TRINITY_DN2209_c0_g2_i2.p3  ORF type:complete len:100 (-),score=20.04 TRINITY_DN2209_c0_g2_i2:490-789(-)